MTVLLTMLVIETLMDTDITIATSASTSDVPVNL